MRQDAMRWTPRRGPSPSNLPSSRGTIASSVLPHSASDRIAKLALLVPLPTMTMTTPILKPAGLCTSQPKVAVVTKLFDSDSDGDSEFSKLSRSRRPSYFQSCMNRFMQLAAYVETELGQSRRDWKHKITPWRNEQRDLIMKLAQTGASGRKTFHWVKGQAVSYCLAYVSQLAWASQRGPPFVTGSSCLKHVLYNKCSY